MNSQAYWRDRVQRADEEVEKDINKIIKKIINEYKKSSTNLVGSIAELHNKYETGEITHTEMLKHDNLKDIYKDMEQICKELANKEIKLCKDNFPRFFEKGFGSTGDILNVKFSLISKEAVAAAVNYPWSGQEYSKRIWTNKTKMLSSLKKNLKKALLEGTSLPKLAEIIAKETGKGAYNASRLIRTESSHCLNAGRLESYKQAGIKEVKYLANLDKLKSGKNRYCEDCKNNHNKIYAINKAPTLPLHPNCRCTYIAIIE